MDGNLRLLDFPDSAKRNNIVEKETIINLAELTDAEKQLLESFLIKVEVLYCLKPVAGSEVLVYRILLNHINKVADIKNVMQAMLKSSPFDGLLIVEYSGYVCFGFSQTHENIKAKRRYVIDSLVLSPVYKNDDVMLNNDLTALIMDLNWVVNDEQMQKALAFNIESIINDSKKKKIYANPIINDDFKDRIIRYNELINVFTDQTITIDDGAILVDSLTNDDDYDLIYANDIANMCCNYCYSIYKTCTNDIDYTEAVEDLWICAYIEASENLMEEEFNVRLNDYGIRNVKIEFDKHIVLNGEFEYEDYLRLKILNHFEYYNPDDEVVNYDLSEIDDDF